MPRAKFKALEICAGAGGQALGLHLAGFAHAGVVEIDHDACNTLRANGSKLGWTVFETDLRTFRGQPFKGLDLLAGGVPCPPFSIAGKQLGADDDRDLFPEALRLVKEIAPRAVMLENVRGLASARFRPYLDGVLERLRSLGYVPDWRVLNASDFGVPQLRPRFLLVALRPDAAKHFKWPKPASAEVTVADLLGPMMKSRGWKGADAWCAGARSIAPTIVGGSKKHGGPDLGPTRARKEWALLGVNGLGVTEDPPGHDFPADGKPKLTVRMVARIQGFPDYWDFVGRKTAAYRQVGNAFPPPVARAVATSIRRALTAARAERPAAAEGKVTQLRRTGTA